MEILIGHGFDGMEQVMAIMVNEAMKIERANALRAAPHERTPARMGRANRYKTKNVKSRLGNLAPAFPQGGMESSSTPRLWRMTTGRCPSYALLAGRGLPPSSRSQISSGV